MRCSGRKQDGSRCKAAALRGGKFCNFHSRPGRAAEVGREGGKRRRVSFDPTTLRRFEVPRSPADLLAIVAQSVIDVREARLDHKTGHSIASLVTVCLSLLRSVSLEERVAALEKRRGETK
jgi:hypothetical protein